MAISKVFFIENNSYEILKQSKELYGDEFYIITKEDIKKLKKGKIMVATPNDEYNCFFTYEDDEKEKNK